MYDVDLTPRRRQFLVCAAMLLLGAAAAQGQGSVGTHWGLSGGPAFPYEDAKDIYDTGYQGAMVYSVNAPIIGLRFETFYSRMNEQTIAGQSGHVLVGGGTANIVIGPKLVVFKPYLIGGGGYYRVKFSATRQAGEIENTQNKFGWNAGFGISFGAGPTGAFFIEGRYVQISTDSNFSLGKHFTFVPVSVGWIF